MYATSWLHDIFSHTFPLVFGKTMYNLGHVKSKHVNSYSYLCIWKVFVHFQLFSTLRVVTYTGRSSQIRLPISESTNLLPFKCYFPGSTYPRKMWIFLLLCFYICIYQAKEILNPIISALFICSPKLSEHCFLFHFTHSSSSPQMRLKSCWTTVLTAKLYRRAVSHP